MSDAAMIHAATSRAVLSLPGRLTGVYFGLVFVLAFTQLDRLLWGWGVLPLPPTVAFVLLSGPLLFLLAVECGTRPQVAAATGQTLAGNFLFFAPLLLLAAANLLAALRPGAFWQDSGSYLLLVPYDCLVFLLGLLLPVLAPVRRVMPAVALAAVLLLAGSIFTDLISPGLFSRVASRAAGVARDPNVAAFLISLALTFVLRFGAFRRRDLLALGLAAAAIAATLSRQGMLLFALLVGVYAFEGATRSRERRFDLRGLLPMGMAAGVVLVGIVGLVLLSRSGSGLFSVYASNSRLEMWTGEADWLEGNVERLELARLFAGEGLKAPLLGHGTAFTYTFDQGPHNRYLQEWVNAGLLALLAYAGWFVAGLVLFRTRRFLPGILAIALVAFDSFFAHGILEQRAVPLALGLAATLSLFAEPAAKEVA